MGFRIRSHGYHRPEEKHDQNRQGKSWMEGREYKHISPDGMPMDNSMCFYDWKAVEKWIENQPAAIPRRKSA